MYLRQVAADAIVNNDSSRVAQLTRVALIMGARSSDPREPAWRLLHYPWQVAEATMDGSPADSLRVVINNLQPVAIEAFDDRVQFLERMTAVPLVEYQPASIPLLEPAWDAEFNAERLGLSSRRLDNPQIPQPVWSVDPPAYREQHSPGSLSAGATRRPWVVDQVNRFLLSGTARDAATAAVAVSGEPASTKALEFAVRYWAGDHWPDHFPELDVSFEADDEISSDLGDGLVVVLRHGAAQISWQY